MEMSSSHRGPLFSLSSTARDKENSSSVDMLAEYVDLDEAHQKSSFMSGASASNMSASAQVGQVAGSSKAVLAALRALQDKIKRLELERSQALEEASQLRHQVKHYEIEIEHTKQREALANQKVMAEATATKERLYTEKAELEVKLARADDRLAEQAKALGQFEFKVRVLEEEKIRMRATLQEFETSTKALETQIAQASVREKDVAQTMVWETKRHEDEVEALQSHISTLSQDLLSAEDKNGELDSMIRKLLSSNEALAGQLAKAERRAAKAAATAEATVGNASHSQSQLAKRGLAAKDVRTSGAVHTKSRPVMSAPIRTGKQGLGRNARKSLATSSGAAGVGAGGGAKKSKATKGRERSSSLPHCALVTTAAAEAQKTSKVEPNPSHWVPGGLRGVDDIHSSLESNPLAGSVLSMSPSRFLSAPPPLPRRAPEPPMKQIKQQQRKHGSKEEQQQRSGRARTRSADSRESRASSTASSRSSASAPVTSSSSLSSPFAHHQSHSQSQSQSQSRSRGKNQSLGLGIGIAMGGSAAGKHAKSRPTASSFWDGYDVLGAVTTGISLGASPASSSKNASGSNGKATKASSSSSQAVKGKTLPPAAASASPVRAAVERERGGGAAAPQVGTAESFAKARDGDLQQVIASLEEEFSALNSQYRSLLKTVSSPMGGKGGSRVDESFEDEKEGQLVDVIQNMHKKSEMLRKLKSPTR